MSIDGCHGHAVGYGCRLEKCACARDSRGKKVVGSD